MRIESARYRIPEAPNADRARDRTRGARVATLLRRIGLFLGMLLFGTGAAIALLALHALYAMPSPDEVERGGDGMETFRCGMPAAVAIVALMFSLPVAAIGGALARGCRPARRRRRR